MDLPSRGSVTGWLDGLKEGDEAAARNFGTGTSPGS